MELELIRSKIYEIRGKRVMLDFDLAKMYQISTKVLKQSVKRNIQRFPNDFMFQLTKNEWNELVTICDQLSPTIKHSSVIPLAFTQEGVASLSGILRSTVAINVYISIMRAFVALRQLTTDTMEIKRLAIENADIRHLLEKHISETDGKIEDIYLVLTELSRQRQDDANKIYPKIGFKK